MGLYDNIIDSIISDAGGAGVENLTASPIINIQIHDHDGYETCDPIFLLTTDGKFEQLALKDYRRKKCEWATNNTLLYTEECRLSFVDKDDYFECTLYIWDNKEKKRIAVEDDFSEAIAGHYHIEREEADKIVEELQKRTKQIDETMFAEPLVFYSERVLQ